MKRIYRIPTIRIINIDCQPMMAGSVMVGTGNAAGDNNNIYGGGLGYNSGEEAPPEE